MPSDLDDWLVCHGKKGMGAGSLAKKLNLRPADLSSGKYQKEKIKTLAEIIGRYRKAGAGMTMLR